MKWLILLLVAGVVSAGIFFGTSGYRDDRAWVSASKINTSDEYASYVVRWRNGRHISEAKIRYDDSLWNEATQALDLELVENYISNLPEGRHLKDARIRYDDIRWSKVEKATSRAPLVQYISDIPDGRHVREAKQHIETIAWHSTSKSKLPSDYRGFLDSYPNGLYSKQARQRVYAILHDDAPYRAALKAGSEESLRKFLKIYKGHVRERQVRQALSFCEGRDIVDLQNAGVIETRVEGSRIQEVSLKVRRRVSYPVTVRIPVGTFFVANNTDVQNMVATEAAKTTLDDDTWAEISVTTACANRPRQIPGEGNHFGIIRGPNQRELARLIPILERQSADYEVRQAAVWIVTDNASFEDLQILVNSMTRVPVIDADSTVKAMKICSEAGINIRRKAIWSDRAKLRQSIEDPESKRWLRQ